MKKIVVKHSGTTLTLLSHNLKYEVERDGFKWETQGRPAHLVLQRKMFGKYCWYYTLFSSALKKSHKAVGNSIVSTFSGFVVYGKKIPAVFTTTATVKDNGKIDFSIKASYEGECDFKAAYYPAPFNAKEYKKENSYSVEAFRQGVMLPDTFEKNRKQILLLTKYWRKVNTGDAYMPLWGRVCGEYGYSAFADESYDLTLGSCYGKDKALITSSNWLGSLGKLSYERTLHTRFYKGCNYVSMAKDFRKHEMKKGNLITLDDKIKSNPNVAKLIGTPVLHWNLYEHNEPGTVIYKETKILDKVHHTFDETCEDFKHLKECGLDKVYVHTDGWGNRGYDNLHPYILPPSDKIGGFDGMRRLSETCQDLGYLFGLHDQYRDYYQDSPVYDKEKCVYDVNGKAPYCGIWAGGPHNWLCSKFAKEHVKRTYDELAEQNINIDGTYLDVFGIMAGDECYHKDHRVTRKESIKYRGKCFDMLRKRGLIVSSEELGCQMVKYLDLVHHAPYAVTPQGGGEQVGIPVPFTNLVYHDCVFVPWKCEGKGGWGIPDGDSGKMHCILNAQTPYVNKAMREGDDLDYKNDEELTAHINEIKEIASINEKLYNAELLNHEFLDKNYRVQRTTFAGGWQITVDFDKDTYELTKAE